jgi:hypothetical protein
MDVEESYYILERVVMYGFYTVRATIAGVPLILKSISEAEHRLVREIINPANFEEDYLYQLGLSTLMVGDINCMEDRFSTLGFLADFYRSMPGPAVVKVRDAIRTLNDDYLEAMRSLEGFCYTDRSRYLWKALRGQPVGNRSPWPGSERAGVGVAYETWVLLNNRMDDEDSYSRELNLALLIAGSMNGKASRGISKQHEQQHQEVVELRKEIARYGYDRKRVEETTKKDRWTAPVNTREDLVRQLYREMTGVKDRHDLFMDVWLERQREVARQSEEAMLQKQQQYKSEMREMDFSKMEDSRPVSLEDIQRIKNGESDRGGMSSGISTEESTPMQEKFMSKVSAKIIRPFEVA